MCCRHTHIGSRTVLLKSMPVCLLDKKMELPQSWWDLGSALTFKSVMQDALAVLSGPGELTSKQMQLQTLIREADIDQELFEVIFTELDSDLGADEHDVYVEVWTNEVAYVTMRW